MYLWHSATGWEYIFSHSSRTVPFSGDGGAMVADPISRELFLVGAYSNNDPFGLYSFKETSGFQGITSESTSSPEFRRGHSLVWDSSNDRFLLYGGHGSLSDLWAWNKNNGWSLLDDGTSESSPIGRFDHAATWDDVTNTMYIYGGSQGGRELWGWNESQGWTLLETGNSADQPPSMTGHSLFWDAPRERIILHNKRMGGEIWSWNYQTGWRRLGLVSMPGVWDSRNNRMLVPTNSQGNTRLEMSEWDESTGTLRRINTSSQLWPSSRTIHLLTYNNTVGALYLFGGRNCGGECEYELWRWDGIWTLLSNSHKNPPSPRKDFAFTTDQSNNLYIFGGLVGLAPSPKGLWKWNQPTGWLSLSSNSEQEGPKSCFGCTLTLNERNNSMYLFGGSTENTPFFIDLNAIWALGFDGNFVRLSSETTSPSKRSFHGAVWHPILSKLFLFAGLTKQGMKNDVWLWDDSNHWQGPIYGINIPPARFDYGITWSSDLQSVVIFGGKGAEGSSLNDLWTWHHING